MINPDEFIEKFLAHAYDSQKAHEYYLLNRDLMGRKKANSAPSSSKSLSTKPSPMVTKSMRPMMGTKKKTALVSVQRQKAVNARVSAIKVRLSKLHDVLADLLKQAEEKDSKTSEDKKTEDKTTDKTSDKKELTTQQKKEASERSKDYYDKNKKDEPKEKSKEEIQKSIAEVRAKIRKIRAELKDAIARARAQSVKTKTVTGR